MSATDADVNAALRRLQGDVDRLTAALVASQAECAALRELVTEWVGRRHNLASAIEACGLVERSEAALSRPPGSREALRAMLLQCAGAVWATAAPSVEMDSEECAAIVARLLPEGGSHE